MIKNDVELNEEVDPKLLIDKLKRDIVQLKEELSLRQVNSDRMLLQKKMSLGQFCILLSVLWFN